jgi:hypothetical protein
MVNPNDKRFYTYAYLREDRTPYYIGKGCGKRAFQKHTCGRPPKDRILFLKQNLTEEEAIKHEIYMIAVFGRKDLGTGCLRNRTDGGDGVGKRVWTPEQRQKAREQKLGQRRSDESKIKQRETLKANPRRWSEETKQKMSASHKKRGKSPEHLEKLRELCRARNATLVQPRFRCLVTGYESTSGGLNIYQKNRKIDISLRERVDAG